MQEDLSTAHIQKDIKGKTEKGKEKKIEYYKTLAEDKDNDMKEWLKDHFDYFVNISDSFVDVKDNLGKAKATQKDFNPILAELKKEFVITDVGLEKNLKNQIGLSFAQLMKFEGEKNSSRSIDPKMRQSFSFETDFFEGSESNKKRSSRIISKAFGSDCETPVLVEKFQQGLNQEGLGDVEDLLDCLELKIVENDCDGAQVYMEKQSKLIREDNKYILTFQNYRKYETLEMMYIDQMEDLIVKASFEKSQELVQKLTELQFIKKACESFYRRCSFYVREDLTKSSKIDITGLGFQGIDGEMGLEEDAKNTELKDIDDIIDYIEKFLGFCERVKDLVKNRFVFETDQTFKYLDFSNWFIDETGYVLSQIGLLLPEEIIADQEELLRLKERVCLKFGEYESKGQCLTFQVEKFFVHILDDGVGDDASDYSFNFE